MGVRMCVLGVRFDACNTLACAVKRGICMRVCVSVCACECVLGVRFDACNTLTCAVKRGICMRVCVSVCV
jgi:hypothetical protein